MTLSRRQWIRYTTVTGLGLGAGLLTSACGEELLAPLEGPDEGHLAARPGPPVFAAVKGVSALKLGNSKRDGFRFIPSTYVAGDVLPLLIVLHGYGGDGYGMIQPYLQWAENNKVALLAPDSRNVSWDRGFGSFDIDVRFMDGALSDTFLQVDIHPAKIAVAGYSDGASYALSLGLTNGDLFSNILAFSPGYMSPNVARGTPTVFVSHGTEDTILRIDRTSRRFVPKLRGLNYEVEYREFDGGHTIPAAIRSEGLQWLTTAWSGVESA